MSKLYASFSNYDLAEKATGALMDFGMLPEDISLIQNGTEQQIREWSIRNEQATMAAGPDFPGSSQYAPEYTGRASTDTGAQYANSADLGPAVSTGAPNASGEFFEAPGTEKATPMDAPASTTYSDPSARAADYTVETNYAEVRSIEDEDTGEDLSAKTGLSTTTAADAGVGAAKGAGWGLGVGIIAGLAAAFIPGFGLALGGGTLAIALGGVVGTTAAGAIAGAVTGYLKDQGMEEHVAQTYASHLSDGGVLIELTLPSNGVDEITAREVLAKYGAANVGSFVGTTKGYVA